MLPRSSGSLEMGLSIFRGPLAWRCAFSSGGSAFLPRFFFGGSGLATTIWAFFWGTGWCSRGRGLCFGFLSSLSSSSEDEEEDEEDDVPEDEDDDDELLDLDTTGMVSWEMNIENGENIMCGARWFFSLDLWHFLWHTYQYFSGSTTRPFPLIADQELPLLLPKNEQNIWEKKSVISNAISNTVLAIVKLYYIWLLLRY